MSNQLTWEQARKDIQTIRDDYRGKTVSKETRDLALYFCCLLDHLPVPYVWLDSGDSLVLRWGQCGENDYELYFCAEDDENGIVQGVEVYEGQVYVGLTIFDVNDLVPADLDELYVKIKKYTQEIPLMGG